MCVFMCDVHVCLNVHKGFLHTFVFVCVCVFGCVHISCGFRITACYLFF